MHRRGAKMEWRVTVDMVTPGRPYGTKGVEKMSIKTFITEYRHYREEMYQTVLSAAYWAWWSAKN
jgi:hypothetical protein